MQHVTDWNLPINFGSVYFKVKTLLKAATEKSAKRLKKTLSNFDDTERDRKAKRTPKELKPLITRNLFPLSVSFGWKEVLQIFFGLTAMRHLCSRKLLWEWRFYFEIITPIRFGQKWMIWGLIEKEKQNEFHLFDSCLKYFKCRSLLTLKLKRKIKSILKNRNWLFVNFFLLTDNFIITLHGNIVPT